MLLTEFPSFYRAAAIAERSKFNVNAVNKGKKKILPLFFSKADAERREIHQITSDISSENIFKN